MDTNTQRYRVLKVLDACPNMIPSNEVATRIRDRLDMPNDVQTNSISATLSKLHYDDLVKRLPAGGDAYKYQISGEGRDELHSAELREVGQDASNDTDLGFLSDMDPEADEDYEITGSVDSEIPAHVVDDLRELNDRISTLEKLLATGEQGVPVTLPIADKDADLDHATIIESLESKYQVRPYLLALFDLSDAEPQDRTASEERASENESVEVVEK